MSEHRRDRIPFPERLIGWFDIAKGVGQVIIESMFYRHHDEPRPSMSEHYKPDLNDEWAHYDLQRDVDHQLGNDMAPNRWDDHGNYYDGDAA